MRPVKIVLVGAGSASFGLSSLATLLREPELRGSTLALVDLNAEALENMHRFAERIDAEWDAGVSIVASVDRNAVLPGADFVVCSIEAGPRSELWRLDYRIPLKHGVRQPFSENGGPAGFAHAARQVPAIMDIACDMERLCPDAWLLNFSNPVPRLTRAVTKYTNVQTVGLCHQIGFAYTLAAHLLADILDIHVPEGMGLHSAGGENWIEAMQARAAFAREAADKLDIKAAGLNHFTWMLQIRDRRDGKDLYPEFKRRFEAHSAEPLTRDVMLLTGVFAIPGDRHLCEYLPWCHNPVTKPWERYDLNPPAFCFEDDGYRQPADRNARVLAPLHDQKDLTFLKDMTSEGVWEVVHGIAADANRYHLSANIPNEGSLPDLPPRAVVEVPVVISSYGITGLAMGHLNPVVAELLRRETVVVDLAIDAAVMGDRELALQALMMDPIVDDIDVGRAILHDYLEEHAPYLPQFHGEWTWK
jgi:alpha-galactosidase